MKSWIWPVAVICAVIGLESLALHNALSSEIREVCGQCAPAEATETQGFGAVDAGDQPIVVKSEGEPFVMESAKCAELGGRTYGMEGASICLLRTLQGVGNETEERIKALENKCLEAGGKYVGQTHKLDVLCDLSEVK